MAMLYSCSAQVTNIVVFPGLSLLAYNQNKSKLSGNFLVANNVTRILSDKYQMSVG